MTKLPRPLIEAVKRRKKFYKKLEKFKIEDAMKITKTYKAVMIGFISLLFLAVGTIPAEDIKEIVKKLRERYEQINTLESEFTQTSIWSLAGEELQSKGKIFLAENNKYRVETDTQIIITDGTLVWTFSKERNQVIIDNLSKSKENPLPRDILLKYTTDSRAELIGETEIGGTPCYQIKFTPKDEESFIISTMIWVNKKSWLAVQIEQEDINENITRYLLHNIQVNPPLSKSLFSYQIPDSIEVVDLR